MNRAVQCSLDEATDFKKGKLDSFFEEYARVVNCFIKLYWNGRPYPRFVTSEEYHLVDSWMMGKARKCAVFQAIEIIKSVQKKDEQKAYRQYKRIYYKCKNSNRNIFGILDKKYTEWIKGRKLRHRVKMPVFNGSTIELDCGLIQIQEGKNSFDLWIRIGSVFGNRFSLILPSRKHRHYNKMIAEGFTRCSSATLVRRDGKYFVNTFFKKEAPEKSSSKEKTLGIDLGINKLLSLSDGRFIGTKFKQLLEKLERRKQKSHNYNQALKEIKCYIGNCINQIEIDDYDVIVIEDLKNITQNGKKLSKSKWLRRKLAHWNIELVHRRLEEKCENSRACLKTVSACHTSQRCSRCGEIHKESRVGELYKCISCGHTLDADRNASINILYQFLNGESAVPRTIKKYESV